MVKLLLCLQVTCSVTLFFQVQVDESCRATEESPGERWKKVSLCSTGGKM